MLNADRYPVTVLLCLFALSACSEKAPDPNDPDLLLINGKIITMDNADSVIEAVSIRGGKIVGLGATSKVKGFAGPDSEIIDLAGKAVTPGLIDVHNHFGWGAADEILTLALSYPEVKSIADVASLIREKAMEIRAGEWILGSEWDAAKLDEQRDITAADLEAVSPDNPVWLLHTSAHYGVANSKALALANITKDTADPDGGVIGRNADGEPNGILVDQAMGLIDNITPPYTTELFDEAISKKTKELSAEGITTIKDPEIDERHWKAYRRAHSRGELTVRVFVLWRVPDTLEEAKTLLQKIATFTDPKTRPDNDEVISGGVKIYIDGSGTARTAWVYDEWNMNLTETDEGNFGLTYIEPEVLQAQIQLFHKAGVHMGVHAIGDRAIDFTMDTYDKALSEDPVFGLRHSIIHCNIPTDRAMDMMSNLQSSFDTAYPEVQPAFLWWIGDAYAANFGEQRNLRVLPLNTFLERGIKWAASSDYNVSPFAPRYGIWASIARQTLFGTHGEHPYGTNESVTVSDALRSYTSWAARQVFLEDKIGSIEAGKYADIVVWDRDPYSVATEELQEMKALLTLFNGEIVYRDAAFD